MSEAAEGRWLAAMRRNDFAAAHAISDAVLAARDVRDADDPRVPYHLRWVWDGRDLRGADVLVRCYHGLGDTIQFARYLAPLAARAASVTVEAQPNLLTLLGGVAGVHRLLPFRPDQPLPPAEICVEIMELSHALRLGALGDRVPYLRAEPLVSRAPAAALTVGLCARAGDWDPQRSVPAATLAQACTMPNVACCDLGNVRGDMAVRETARRIMALNLVVTVDTMVAHLAGALGRPTWLLLKHDCDWRWMAGRDDSPWYPTVRLFRQDVAGDWRGPLAAVRAALALRAAATG